MVIRSDQAPDERQLAIIAEQLGRSVKSVEGLVTRARRELRTHLDADGDERTGRRHG